MQDSWKQDLADGPPLLSLGQPWKASPELSSSSSSAVENATASSSAEVKATPESSDQSGSTLKEHDYIGLAEVSSLQQQQRQQKAADSLDDDTDLNLGLGLGLGPAKKPEPAADESDKTLNTVDSGTPRAFNFVQEQRSAWSSKESPSPNPSPNLNPMFQAPLSGHVINGFPAGRGVVVASSVNNNNNVVISPASKNGMKRGYTEAMTDPAARFNIAPPQQPPSALPPMAGKTGGSSDSETKVVPKHQQAKFLPNWAPSSKPSVPASWLEQPSAHSFGANFAPAPSNQPAASPAAIMNAPRVEKPATVVDCPPPAYKPHEASEAAQDSATDEAPPAKGRVVGWPPIRSYRKNTLAKPPEMFVKVNMDGVTVGRKVDLNAHSSYEGLLLALEEMFQPSNTTGTSQAAPGRENDVKHFRLMNGSDYVLTYEDKDGDWMLVGDVPWSMFTNTVRRLRIQRGTEATGLAPRASEKAK